MHEAVAGMVSIDAGYCSGWGWFPEAEERAMAEMSFLALGIFYFHQIQPLGRRSGDEFVPRILLLKKPFYDAWLLMMMPD